MKRRIIEINTEKCSGCGGCAAACHEGAIGMVDGKAKLLRDDYCDGLGDCLPTCPTGAITFVEREALAYDEQAVLKNKENPSIAQTHTGCPGQQLRQLRQQQANTATPSAPVRSWGSGPARSSWFRSTRRISTGQSC